MKRRSAPTPDPGSPGNKPKRRQAAPRATRRSNPNSSSAQQLVTAPTPPEQESPEQESPEQESAEQESAEQESRETKPPRRHAIPRGPTRLRANPNFPIRATQQPPQAEKRKYVPRAPRPRSDQNPYSSSAAAAAQNDTVMFNSSSPYVNPYGPPDLCRHNVAPLWDNPDAPGAPQPADKLREPRTIAAHLPPLNDIEEIFEVAVRKALDQGLEAPLKYLAGRSLRVATMCSGTESPILALGLISKALQKNHGTTLKIDHIFSAEIVPYKQAYIERNFHPDIIFRDIRELAGGSEATTAYGNKVPIPSDVDILVAGTSCVDFSNLNNHALELADGGESAQTFRAFVDYIAKYRPAICILENVQSAPWTEIQAILANEMGELETSSLKAFSGIWKADDKGYAAALARLDTKDYYIPQTRQRGYMVAIDRRQHEDADNAVKFWVKKMTALKQPASSSAESFLSEDVARLGEFKSSALPKKPRAVVDWDCCLARYQDYRSEKDLGSRRPLTQWVGGGSCTGPDHWDIDWARTLVERMWDTLDVSHLRNALKGFDDCYKTRTLELTQNVDRATDAQGHGLVSCLTPSGLKFLTTRGSPLTGREALLLQGLPVHKLLLTNESQRELLDLAGNAMTTTVVGTALLAALIAGHKAISMDFCRANLLENPVSIPAEEMICDALLPDQTLDLAEYKRCILDDLCSKASASTRLCLCEGRTLTLERSFKKCKLCAHTACEKCAGTPRHDYCVLPKSQRMEPSSFIKWITDRLPMRVQLVGFDFFRIEELYADCKSHSIPEGQNDWNIYKRALEQALGEDLRFESVTRFRQWVVRYDAPRSYLELTIGESPYWRLFVKPERQEPNNSRLRWLLKNPVARMRLIPGDDFLAGEWEFYLPVFLQCSLKIEGFGSMTNSWESHLGIQIKTPAVEKVHTKLKVSVARPVCRHIARSIDDVVGEYELLEDCGTACRSLHKRINLVEGPSVYFFLDAQRIGPPQYDRFSFSQDHHRLTFGEVREVIGSLDPKWRQGRAEATEETDPMTVECRLYGLWEACGATLRVFKGRPGLTYAVPRSDFPIKISPGVACNPNLSAGIQVCSADTMTFISWKVPLTQPENIGWNLGPWRQVDQESETLSLRSFSWLFQKSKDLRQFRSEWRRLSLPDEVTRCQSCSPDAPSIKWRQGGDSKGAVIPYEDERQAGVFERAIKARAKPFVTQTRLDTDECGGFIGYLQVGINITALAHRVLSKTPFGAGKAIELSWCLNTAYEWPLEMEFDKFTLRDNKDGEEEEHVFVQHPSQDERCVELGRLRKEQRRSLCWMKQQESDGTPPFLEQEIEEAYLPTLGWLAETIAKFPSRARGGVLADDVGYGKTATTLALINATMEKASELSKETFGEGIAIKATLIIVPSTLMVQWKSQIAKFLGEGYPVIKINNFIDLGKVHVRDIQRASIILLNWRLLCSPAYLRNFGAFAAMPECSSWAGRPYKTWLEQAVKRLDDHAKELDSCADIEDFERIHDERVLMASQNDDAAIPSRRVRGAAIQQGKKEKDAKPKPKANQPVKRVSTLKPFGLTEEGKLLGMKSPPIQLFNFHRIVIDEYTYLEDPDVHAISSLRATNRWVLSGTPKMVDFADIKLLAGLIKVNLGVDDDAPIALQKSSIDKIQGSRTAAEKFRSYVEVHSPQWHAHRIKHAQEFLHHFARKNAAEIDEIEAVEILKPVALSGGERAVFMELQQQLYTQEIRLCRGSSNKIDGDRVARMKNILRTSKSPEEALLKGCLHSVNETSTIDSQNSFGKMIKQRQAEYQVVHIELRKNLRHAVWLQKQLDRLPSESKQASSYEKWVRDFLVDHDPEGSVDLKKLLVEAENSYRFDHQDDFYRDEPSKEQKAKERAEWKKRNDAAKNVAKATTKEMRRTSSALAESTKGNGQVHTLGSGSQESDGTDDTGEILSEKPTRIDEEALSIEPLQPIEPLDLLDSRLSKINLDNRDVITNSVKILMTHIRKLGSEFISRRRALRFLNTTQKFNFWQRKMGPQPICLSCGEAAEDPSNIFVLGLCGHVACKECLEKRSCVAGCVSDDCSSAAGPQHIHPAKCFGSRNQPSSSHGTKLDSIISLIQEAAKQDQFLLFVQFPTILDDVCRAFETSGISYYAVRDGATAGAAAMAHDFQENQSEKKKKVLILNPSNESAAGLNLVNANHVVFVSPLLSESMHEFHESRTQCIGRARRYGQTKKVYVYDFLALNSIDVDITEDQRCKRLVQDSSPNGEEVWKLKSEEDMTNEEKAKKWGSGWTKRNFFEE